MSACSIPAGRQQAAAAEGPGLNWVQSAHLMGMRTGWSARFIQVLLLVRSISTPTCCHHSLFHKLVTSDHAQNFKLVSQRKQRLRYNGKCIITYARM